MARPPQIRIELAGSEPAVRQIAAQIRAAILEGSLAPGTKLPAVRRLALDLGVHFNTVAEAYRQLAAEGLLAVSHGKAAAVAGRKIAPATPEEAGSLLQRLRQLAGEMRARRIPARAIRKEIERFIEE
jgi:DNA-binding transcriptional regulator YhcF (GntR family)